MLGEALRFIVLALLPCAFFVLGSVPAFAKETTQADPIFLGVLEEETDARTSDSTGNFVVRVLFAYKNGAWKSLDSIEAVKPYDLKRVTWYVAKGSETLETTDPDPQNRFEFSWVFPRDKKHNITSNTNIKAIAKKKKGLEGWNETPSFGLSPLTNHASAVDREAWALVHLNKDESKTLFSKVNPQINDPCTARKRHLRHGELDLNHVYKNAAGEMLVAYSPNKAIFARCDGPPMEYPPFVYWISDQVKKIGNNLALIEVADFDGDGKNEFLFWHSGYNEDGYLLYSNRFRKVVKYYWHYH